ncbi:putative flagellar biosynthetic protein FliR [Acetobacteraceae bacterium AT-5844]|nr:putative flagellar biosynthetic protein FliR [Acetobacteraceae bacterium AT-5844]
MVESAYPLATWLPAEIYRLALVFCRISAALMLLPGFGEHAVPVRIRILTGLAAALCIAPLAGPALPVPSIWGGMFAVVMEVTTGTLLGVLSRILLSAIQTAGQVIGLSIGLSNAFVFGVGNDNSAVVGAALYVGGLAALFTVEGHHSGLRALAESYAMVPLGAPPPLGGSAAAVTSMVTRAFRLAMQLSMPFLALAVLFNLAMAGINRAMPAMPVFMIGAPALLMAGLQLLALTAPGAVAELLGAYADVFVMVR